MVGGRWWWWVAGTLAQWWLACGEASGSSSVIEAAEPPPSSLPSPPPSPPPPVPPTPPVPPPPSPPLARELRQLFGAAEKSGERSTASLPSASKSSHSEERGSRAYSAASDTAPRRRCSSVRSCRASASIVPWFCSWCSCLRCFLSSCLASFLRARLESAAPEEGSSASVVSQGGATTLGDGSVMFQGEKCHPGRYSDTTSRQVGMCPSFFLSCNRCNGLPRSRSRVASCLFAF